MTDIFGNYVIQKLFEHGNQSQKKVLANQMKGHMVALSTQMYGCRVVQKVGQYLLRFMTFTDKFQALEHILTDQQASLIKELEKDVIKVVKCQNGNHVVQKAIERIPAEHIQFIIDAFVGQVPKLAAHPYGCRVIQRMLEHCTDEARASVLAELHTCAASLIPDQYGNYVIQHVIEHGAPDDRNLVVSLVIARLLELSRHKFASNVVERCIQFGTDEQRAEISATVTALNDKGESPLLYLIRDQYGNYVIRKLPFLSVRVRTKTDRCKEKLIIRLQGSERDALIDQIKPLLSTLKKFAHGKQIGAIEKIIYELSLPQQLESRTSSSSLANLDTNVVPTTPLLTGDERSPPSSEAPSIDASAVEGSAPVSLVADDRKSGELPVGTKVQTQAESGFDT